MDKIKISSFYIAGKTLKVMRKRFFFEKGFRVSQLLDFFSDNLWKVVPQKKIRTVYNFLNNLVDRILWL